MRLLHFQLVRPRSKLAKRLSSSIWAAEDFRPDAAPLNSLPTCFGNAASNKPPNKSLGSSVTISAAMSAAMLVFRLQKR